MVLFKLPHNIIRRKLNLNKSFVVQPENPKIGSHKQVLNMKIYFKKLSCFENKFLVVEQISMNEWITEMCSVM